MSNTKAVIKVCDVSKTYRVWKTPMSRLMVPLASRIIKPLFPNWFHKYETENCQYVNALKNVNFEVYQGGSLGIIGLNGSGKSTILQIIAGTLTASSGHVEVTGRVAALLELGSGFDPEFTGRENIYLNASILGMSQEQIKDRYDDIVAFADIGEFIERPVKTYSSGMVVRLAFAVQVHVDPDILIVDEALAVGDARFQAKALSRIEEIIQKGTSLLFVGHDLAAVRSFCTKAMLLDKGEVIAEGIPDDVSMEYLKRIQQNNNKQTDKSDKAQVATDKSFAIEGVGVKKAIIENYGDHAALQYGSMIHIVLDLEIIESLSHPVLILDLVDTRGLQLTGKRIPIPKETMQSSLRVSIECCFQLGIYRFRFRVVNAPSIEQTELISRQDDLLSLEMVEDVRDVFTGLFPANLSYKWNE